MREIIDRRRDIKNADFVETSIVQLLISPILPVESYEQNF